MVVNKTLYEERTHKVYVGSNFIYSDNSSDCYKCKLLLLLLYCYLSNDLPLLLNQVRTMKIELQGDMQ